MATKMKIPKAPSSPGSSLTPDQIDTLLFTAIPDPTGMSVFDIPMAVMSFVGGVVVLGLPKIAGNTPWGLRDPRFKLPVYKK